ncbi:manganese efflux pump MntP [Candidatus Methanobinarius endosymbioticus]|uniref:Manganese efflux pump MntP n=1 Tax=Candidatus Methanobinarius endosymbioticus TaxID=2006182 RepID=A0A366M8Z1_9EURY|nr:manganese efflux pump MntP [Candidatus Methanobinarius endosymbioticus]
MIYESLKEDKEDETTKKKNKFSFKELALLAIATSIDVFVVGGTFALLKTPIIVPLIFTGVIIGQKIGSFFGDKFEIIGGIVLGIF